MKLGIVGALEEELTAVRDLLQEVQNVKIRGRTYTLGKFGPHDVVVVRCDIGKVNAAIATQSLIDLHDAQAIIALGSAGALSPALELGDLVIARDCIQVDVDLTGWGLPPGAIMFDAYLAKETGSFDFKTKREFGTDETLAKKTIEAANKVDLECVDAFPPEIHHGRVLSADRFISDFGSARDLLSKYNGLCSDMEAAAIAQTCVVNGVPSLILCTISDKADGKAAENFREFLLGSTRNYALIMEELLQQL